MPHLRSEFGFELANLLRVSERSRGPSRPTAIAAITPKSSIGRSFNFQSSYTFHGHITTYFWVDSY